MLCFLPADCVDALHLHRQIDSGSKHHTDKTQIIFSRNITESQLYNFKILLLFGALQNSQFISKIFYIH